MGSFWSKDQWTHRTETVSNARTQIRRAFGAGWRFRVQLPLVLSLHTDPLPDIAVVPGVLVGNPGHPTTAALVVEVADTTFDTDTTEKAELYATVGIADYWVLDVVKRELHVFRDPQPLPLPALLAATAYQTHNILNPADTVSPLAAQLAPRAAPTVPSHSELRGAETVIRVADLLP